jgi:hypothetical protein
MNLGRPIALGNHKKRFAVRRKNSTDPDVITTAVMLSALRTAVDSTIGKCPDAFAVALARRFLHFDCFLAAMMSPLGVRPHLQPDPDASLSKLIFDRAPSSQPASDEKLKRSGQPNMFEPDGLRMQPGRSPGFSGANPNNCDCHRQAYDESAGNGQSECEKRICFRAHIA